MAKAPIPPPGQQLAADDYLAAARDVAASLPSAYENGDYAVTIYLAGLSVECVLRAYRDKKGLAFRSDHALLELANESGFPTLLIGDERAEFDAAFALLVKGWRNSHRFRSKEAMRRYLKGQRLDRTIKGDFLKEVARRMSSAAVGVVHMGVKRWLP